MRKIAILAISLVTLVAFSGCGSTGSVSIEPTNVQPGMNVAAIISENGDMRFYSLVSLEEDGTSFAVKLINGDEYSIKKSEIKYVVPAKLDLKVGDSVVAPNSYTYGTFMRGKIKEVKSNAYAVTWDNTASALADEDVEFGRILPGNLVTYKCTVEPCFLK